MAQTGSLAVQVFASRAQLPVEGATVAVTRHGPAGKQELISLQETDRSGNTRPISIPTPDQDQSTRPGPLEQPFAQFSIWVEHPAYELMLMEDVQIFPGVESVQMVELSPLIRGEQWTQQPQLRLTPPQDL